MSSLASTNLVVRNEASKNSLLEGEMRHTKTIHRRRHANAVLMFVVLHVGIFGRAQSCGAGYEEINGQ